MSQICLGLLVFLTESFKLFCIMRFMLCFDLKRKEKVLLYIVILAVLSGVIGGIGGLTWTAYFSVIAMICIFQGKGKVLYSLFFFFSVGFFDNLCGSVILLLLNVDYSHLAENELLHYLTNTTSLFFLLLWVIVKKKQRKTKPVTYRDRIDRKWLLFVLLGEMALSFFVQAFRAVVTRDVPLGKEMAVALCFGSIIFVFIICFFMMSMSSREHYKELSQVKERLLESQTRYYKMLLEKEVETRAFRHDINHHLYCMSSLFGQEKYEELKEYFDKISVRLEELRPTIQTGNEMVNVILNSVAGKYPDISYKIDGLLPADIGLSNSDICTIFFNLLENAFMAANQASEKRITLAFLKNENHCYCEIENTVVRQVEIRNNRMVTQKNDKQYHGYGTGNVVECVERNGGEILFSCNDKIFSAKLILKIGI